MKTDLSEYLSAGYCIAKRVTRPTYTSEALLPSKILSLSPCIGVFVPDTWCISWTGDDATLRAEKAKAFDLSSEVFERLTEWVTERMDQDIGWPNVCYSLETAKSLVRKFLQPDHDLVVVGLGLHRQYREVFCRTAEPPPSQEGYAPMGRQGIHSAILKEETLKNGGKPLGFEPLVFNHSLSDSWLCNGLEVVIAHQLGIVPNASGLIDDIESAAKCVECISSENVNAEPGLWLPWLLVEYLL